MSLDLRPEPAARPGVTRRHLLRASGATWLAAVLPLHAASPGLLARFARGMGEARVDHSSWSALLARFTSMGGDGIQRVDYRAWQRDGVASGNLQRYIDGLARVDTNRLRRDEQFAFWANLYNAVTVRTVLEAYPVASIRDIGGGWLTKGPWKEPRVQVGGASLSLDDIEHGLLRPGWRDPRVHYAVNCASLGCPDLRRAAFTGVTLARDLDDAAGRYVNHRRGVSVERERIVVSSIYRWYAEDFGANDAGIIGHVLRYASPQLAALLRGRREIDDDAYDWRLNDVATRQ